MKKTAARTDNEERALKLQVEWAHKLTEIAQRYRAVDMQLPFMFELNGAAMVLLHGLTPENVERWAEGRILEFERIAKKWGRPTQPTPKRRKKRKAAAE